VLQYYVGAISLYIQEGRQDKGWKTAPPSQWSGLSHVQTPPHHRTPPLVSHVWMPPYLQMPPYSDTSPSTEDAKEHRRRKLNGQYRNKQQQDEKCGKIPVSSDASLKLITM